MPKAKPRKGKNNVIEEKKKELKKFWDSVHVDCEELETRVNNMCKETCSNMRKIYADKLKALPENVRNMTLTEYMQYTEKQRQEQCGEEVVNELLICRSQYEKQKLESEKKRTLKKNRIERKRSVSVSSSVCSSTKSFASNLLNSSRHFSESSLTTPLSKRSAISTCIVTPKFNPKAPISKACMRRPRAGEVVMSLSGSPLHNFVDEKPGVAVSLGGGKIIKITEDTELAKLESDFLKKLDHETKSTLESVKVTLDKILKA